MTVRSTVGAQIYHYQFRSEIPAFLLESINDRKRFPAGRIEQESAQRPIILIILDRD
ncbi:MAG: hypothetical protein MUC97_11490 [Bernardetiaceae bacterium]|nr:hypothetical protein [Bernardetiaceae bacterium]